MRNESMPDPAEDTTGMFVIVLTVVIVTMLMIVSMVMPIFLTLGLHPKTPRTSRWDRFGMVVGMALAIRLASLGQFITEAVLFRHLRDLLFERTSGTARRPLAVARIGHSRRHSEE